MIARRVCMYVSVWMLPLMLLMGCGGTTREADFFDVFDADPHAMANIDEQGRYPVVEVSQLEAEPEDGDWLISRLNSEPAHLNVLLDTSDAYAYQLTSELFESLLTRDPETLLLVPSLAESFDISEDKLTYTFTIRRNAWFSDGEPLTAHDVEFTFNMIMDPVNETNDLKNYYKDVESVELLDDYTIRFNCTIPYFKHLDMIGGMPVYPRHIYGVGDFNTHPNNREPIGSGPYMFERWDTNVDIRFVRNDNYWNPEERGHLKRFVYKVVSDDNAAFQLLSRGDLDVMGMTPEQWQNAARQPRILDNYYRCTYWATTGYVGTYSYIGWNLRKPVFEDKRVRQALTMLHDRERVLNSIYHGLGKVVSGGASFFSPEYDQTIEPWPFDPEAARALLDEAGWVDSNGDGWRDKDGVTLRFSLLMPSNNREVERWATVYKEQLARAGIDMSIDNLEWATMLDRLTKRQFDAVTLGWAIPVDQDPYQVWHSSQSDQGSNYPGFQHPEVDRILEEARREFDRDRRSEMYREWHRILHEEQPYTFLFCNQRLVAISRRFQNVRIYPQGLRQREWWVPADQQKYTN